MPKIKSQKLTEIFLDRIAFDNGQEVHYVYFNYPESVAILPVLDNGNVILVKQFRYAIKKESWEIPAGSVLHNENPEDAARRELLEETGFECGELKLRLSFFPSNAMSNEKIHIFIAKNMKKVGKIEREEPIEKQIEIGIFSINKLKEMIINEQITDAATIIAILHHLLF